MTEPADDTADTTTLGDRIPEGGFDGADDALEVLLDWVIEQGIEPYPHQEEAFLEIFAGAHVLLKTPTGSGKSLVATAMHFHALSRGERSVYTAPIKALVSEKFFALCKVFGPERVGLMTGDGTVNADAPIVCCTAEILSQMALRRAEDTPFSAVIMDEFHFYGDRDRGMAWQVPLLVMTRARFLLMSATLGDTSVIEEDLARRTGIGVSVVDTAERPVPLTFEYSEEPLLHRLEKLLSAGQYPVYAVHFSQREATELAQALLSTNLCSDDEKKALKKAVKGFRFSSPFGKRLRRMVLHGVAVHHAGLLPKYRLLVERLSQEGLFKVICGTDTLGVGINVPIRTVLFSKLCKFDGQGVDLLTVRDFHQIAGRAGRKGFDTEGLVVVQAPEWVIENEKLKQAIAEGRKSKKKTKLNQPPTKGYKHWDEPIFQRIVDGRPEALQSRFDIDYGVVLSALRRAEETGEDPVAFLGELIDRSHATAAESEELLALADQRIDALVAAGVVERLKTEDGTTTYEVYDDLQDDFSLHHALSLFLLHALGQLDREAPDHALDVVTLVESILEHPKPVLSAQLRRERGKRIGELKAEGVPYEERMEALEEVTYPKPRARWIYDTFEAYAEARPWLQGDPIRPKSVAREMYETQATFSTYVSDLKIDRLEGVLLRYLTQVYKTLLQNVPEGDRTPELLDILAWYRALLARVDDSLLSTWEDMKADDLEEVGIEVQHVDISADERSFKARIRAELHGVVLAMANEDWDEAEASIRTTEAHPFDKKDFRRAARAYVQDRGERIVFDAQTRQAWNTGIEALGDHRWKVWQRLDGEEDSGWAIEGMVDLSEDTDPSGPLVEVVAIRE